MRESVNAHGWVAKNCARNAVFHTVIQHFTLIFITFRRFQSLFQMKIIDILS